MNQIFYMIDGNIRIVSPSKDLNIQDIINKDVPSGTPYLILDSSELPNDAFFIDAWDIDFDNSKIFENIEKARDICRNKLREDRIPYLEKLDIDFTRALEENNEALKQEIIAKKQKLRDAPADPRIENAISTEELKNINISLFL